jgi:hypothetical protein
VELAEGFVRDFRGLGTALSKAQGGAGDAVLQKLAAELPDAAKQALQVGGSFADASQRRELLKGLNELIVGPDLAKRVGMPDAARETLQELTEEHGRLLRARDQLVAERERLAKDGAEAAHRRKLLTHRSERLDYKANKQIHLKNRRLIEAAFPEFITPMPQGEGVLLDDGHDDPMVVGSLVSGWSGSQALGLFDLPWDAWWPSLRLWGTVAILLALAALCIAVIVHPQWTHRELLPYPIVGFLRDIVHTDTPGFLPNVCRSNLFWAGLFTMLSFHLINGLHAWFPQVPAIPLDFNFSRLILLFPEIEKVGWTIHNNFQFQLYPIVIAFTYFIRSDVAFSLGVSNIAWTMLGVVFISNGVALQSGDMGWSATDLVRLGANVGLTAAILFTGRRYYLNVVASAFGFRRHEETPKYSVWAARGLLVCIIGTLYVLQRFAGLNWLLSATMVFAILMASLVMARINAEGGVFLLGSLFRPSVLVPSLFGFKAVAPSQYFVMSTMQTTVWGDPRGAAMPFLLNGLHASESIAKQPPRRTAPWLAIIIVVGFIASMCVAFLFQHNLGANMADNWSRTDAMRQPFDNLTQQVARLSAHEELSAVVGASDWQRFTDINPDATALAWITFGFMLVILFTAARLRISWWPIHPIMFAVMAVWEVIVLAHCFLLGWAIRVSVMKIGGARAYHAVKPLMIGIIAGELFSVIGWTIVGGIYYGVTGLTPTVYSILPE